MQRTSLFMLAKGHITLWWRGSLFARHKLVRELSIVLLIKLALLYGIVNFIVPAATTVNDSDVTARLLNPQKNPVTPQSSASSGLTGHEGTTLSSPTTQTDTAMPSLRENRL